MCPEHGQGDIISLRCRSGNVRNCREQIRTVAREFYSVQMADAIGDETLSAARAFIRREGVRRAKRRPRPSVWRRRESARTAPTGERAPPPRTGSAQPSSTAIMAWSHSPLFVAMSGAFRVPRAVAEIPKSGR